MTTIKSEHNLHAPPSPEVRKKVAELYTAGVSTQGLKIRFGRYGAGVWLKRALAEHNVPERGKLKGVKYRLEGAEP